MRVDSIEACPAWTCTASCVIPALRSGQAGAPQLVAGRMGQAGPAAGTIEDLIQAPPLIAASHGAVPSGPRTPARAGPSRALRVEVGADLSEEPRRDRDQPLVAALALRDEQPPLPEP